VHSLLDNDDGGDDDLTRFSPILNCAVCVKWVVALLLLLFRIKGIFSVFPMLMTKWNPHPPLSCSEWIYCAWWL
jgi:type III secretory pathway component EscT